MVIFQFVMWLFTRGYYSFFLMLSFWKTVFHYVSPFFRFDANLGRIPFLIFWPNAVVKCNTSGAAIIPQWFPVKKTLKILALHGFVWKWRVRCPIFSQTHTRWCLLRSRRRTMKSQEERSQRPKIGHLWHQNEMTWLQGDDIVYTTQICWGLQQYTIGEYPGCFICWDLYYPIFVGDYDNPEEGNLSSN